MHSVLKTAEIKQYLFSIIKWLQMLHLGIVLKQRLHSAIESYTI